MKETDVEEEDDFGSEEENVTGSPVQKVLYIKEKKSPQCNKTESRDIEIERLRNRVQLLEYKLLDTNDELTNV